MGKAIGLRGLLIIVVGLAFEARIAAGRGNCVVSSGDGQHLAARLTAAIAEARSTVRDCPGIVSFGVAGGLAPQLRPGDCIIGSASRTGTSLRGIAC
jgi:nucleoside phosphorylase